MNIFEILNLEPYQLWSFSDGDIVFRFDENGRREYYDKKNELWKYCDNELQLYTAIKFPESLIRYSSYTDKDIVDAKAVKQLWPEATAVLRPKEKEEVEVYNKNRLLNKIPSSCFPTIRLSKKIQLKEIFMQEGFSKKRLPK